MQLVGSLDATLTEASNRSISLRSFLRTSLSQAPHDDTPTIYFFKPVKCLPKPRLNLERPSSSLDSRTGDGRKRMAPKLYVTLVVLIDPFIFTYTDITRTHTANTRTHCCIILYDNHAHAHHANTTANS